MGNITNTIISEVAEKQDVDPLELEPLYTSVDPDALTTLFEESNDVNHLSFTYAGYEVIVEDEDQIHLEST